MASGDRQRIDEALEWVRRIHDPSFTDWEAHAAWLEADPRNPGAFDRASLLIETATTDLAPPPPYAATSPIPTNDNAAELIVAPRRWMRWVTGLGAAIAASLVALVAAPSLMRGGARHYLLETGAGEHRSVGLADGTTIALNGDSRVRLDHGDARVAVLERGEAFFIVKHDPVHPFAVRAGGATFQDVGTAFDIVHRAGFTQVDVREGAMLYDPGGSAVRLGGGQSIRIADDTATVRAVEKEAVGGWRSGRLLYQDAPLPEVAGDIARNIGQPVSVDPALTRRRFNGVVMIDADRPLMFRRMAAVMGIEIRRASNGWRMVMPAR